MARSRDRRGDGVADETSAVGARRRRRRVRRSSSASSPRPSGSPAAGRRARRRSPRPAAGARAARPRRTPDADRRSRPPTPIADARPDARRPIPTPVTVPAPLTGALVSPAVAARHPIAVMIDDLGAGPAAVRPVIRVGRLAGAGRGRHPALHGDLPGRRCRGRRPGPQRPLLLHRLGRRVARGLRPRRRLAAGARRRCGRRAAASTSTTPTSSATAATFHRSRDRFAPHNLYTTGKTLRKLGKQRRRQGQGLQAGLAVRADAPLDARPYGGTITVAYPANTISYRTTARPTRTCAR